MKARSFFIMDENFLLNRERAHRTAGLHEEGEQELGLLRLLLRQRHPALHHGGTGASWASPGSGWDWNRRNSSTRS